MELQQLRYVVAVADTRSFTRAAERCFVVQSALSHQIKALERELGTTLFARSSRRVEPTTAGEAFVLAARDCLAAAERALTSVATADGEVRGQVRLGLIPSVTGIDVPGALADLHRAHPQVRVVTRTGSSTDFITGIRQGQIDVAVLGLPDDVTTDAVATHVLAREQHVAVLPVGHRLAHRRRIRLAELADEAFADFPEGSPGRAQSDLAATGAGMTRQVPFELAEVPLILGLVERGLAVTLLPPALVTATTARVVPVRLADGPRRTEYLAWSDFNPSPAASALVDIVRARQP